MNASEIKPFLRLRRGVPAIAQANAKKRETPRGINNPFLGVASCYVKTTKRKSYAK